MLDEESIIKGIVGGGKTEDKELFVRGNRTKCHHLNRIGILKEHQRSCVSLVNFPAIKVCLEKTKSP